ncbi:MAG: MgtC/SapB family protein [Clostridia bacterium]|nr:MgtC/SapB family protein [Clostridia bacterium]
MSGVILLSSQVNLDWSLIKETFMWDSLKYDLLKLMIAVICGAVIGSERSRHGRAAGMRTHILVCLGACMTSMTSIFVADTLLNQVDVLRIPAQVISGIGFLGAGMIILKSNNVITGLTTAAGIWATGVIGIAVGYGFFTGALISVALFLITITLFSKFERRKRLAQVFYVEVGDMYQTNRVIDEISALIVGEHSIRTIAPRSEKSGNIGLNVVIERRGDLTVNEICEIKDVVFAIED